MKTTTDMQLVPISKLVPYVNNARTHSPEQVMKLRSSLREFGFINPIIIDRDYGIIAGHGRLFAAKEEGITEVPCVFVDYLTEAQKKAYILADNRMAMDAGWDEELLRVEIEALQGEAFDVSLTGFDEKELADLFKDGSDSDAEDDDYDLSAALEKAAFVKRGDIWTVGRHRLMCGDATSAEDVAALMDGRKANLILTDPPYGVSFKSSSGLTIQNDSMKDEEFYRFLLASFKNMADHLEKGGAAYVFHADTEGLNFRRAFIDAGFHLAGCCIWVKDSLVLGRSDYQWQHEPVLYGFMQNGKHPWYSDRKQTTIWNFAKPKRNANHPTSKPLDLLGYPIGNSTQENAIVIDAADSYSNGNLTELYLGNNTLLRTLDVRNCPNLKQAVDVSGCTNIEHLYFEGTAVTGVQLPNGGILKTLHLPETVTNLTIRNQTGITDFVIGGCGNISTLRLENVSEGFDLWEILHSIPAGARVRVTGLERSFEDAADILAFYDLLDTMRGLDENGNNTEKAQICLKIALQGFDDVPGYALHNKASNFLDFPRVLLLIHVLQEIVSTLFIVSAKTL